MRISFFPPMLLSKTPLKKKTKTLTQLALVQHSNKQPMFLTLHPISNLRAYALSESGRKLGRTMPQIFSTSYQPLVNSGHSHVFNISTHLSNQYCISSENHLSNCATNKNPVINTEQP